MPTPRHVPGLHACPHCRRPAVPDHLYCCANRWRALPADVRLEILVTARLNILHPDRRVAFAAARAAYAAHVAAQRAELQAKSNDQSDVGGQS